MGDGARCDTCVRWVGSAAALGAALLLAPLACGCDGVAPIDDAAVPSIDAGLDAARSEADAGNDAPRVEPDAAIEIDAAPDAWEAPVLTVEPRMLDFGSVLRGTWSTEQTVRVTNEGPTTSGSVDVLLVGRDARAFVVERDTCRTRSLAPGASCEIDVTLQPADVVGDVMASLEVSAASGSTETVTLAGRSVVPIDAVLEPSSVEFAPTTLGSSTEAREFTLRTFGTDPTGLVTVAIAGANPSDFVVDDATSTCPGASVPAMGTCVVRVLFRPTARGSRSAVLRLTASPGGAASADLAGTGLSP